ncbi:MAG: serine/threonine protein kinase [Planctomycetes bacterium]|jgi:serine/threonine protein kinase|nr:serine/threonine protein kinase [Planctomycetota bacterium]MCC7063668.1 serine/threonine protein kinase [Planctomycetota bacterium]
MMKLAVGEIVQGYRITRFLGRGGFASVYLAQHEETGNKVALKVGASAGGGRQVTRLLEVTSRRTPEGISPDELPAEAVFFEPRGVRIDLFDEQEVHAMLRAEGDLLAGCQHDNVVTLLDRLTVDGNPVLVMEYVRGKTLREKIRSLEGIHLNWFLAVVRALLATKQSGALDYHGDLKPENLIVKPSGKVVILDPAMRLPERRIVTTTPHYNPMLLTDSKADVMAIGIMIYEILTGTLPFDEVPWEFAGQQSGGETQRLSLSYFFSYSPPHVLNPKTPEELERIIYRCITVPTYGLDELKTDLETFISKA